MRPRVSVIIAAGGRGVRFGGRVPKQLLEVRGRAVLERSVAVFRAHPSVDEVVVALPDEWVSEPPAYLREAGRVPVTIVGGGVRRQDSVANAFRATHPGSDVVLIHDAARPFATAALIERTIAAARESGAALAAVAARDTVKRAVESRESSGGFVVGETIPRETIHLAQTPQGFRRAVLEAALALADDATDEAALAERAGFAVRLVEGEMTNIKITTPDDLVVAEAIAASREGRELSMRAGTGYDLHRLVEGRPLVLGGVTIPYEKGLLGHSDADAICHAVTDAVLGAAAAGDIGRHFPDTDAAWKGASSIALLEKSVEVVRGMGWSVGNVDVVVIAERPKLAPHVEAMRTCVAAALGVAVACVSIKGKTNEGVGEIGRGEAIAVHAVATLVR